MRRGGGVEESPHKHRVSHLQRRDAFMERIDAIAGITDLRQICRDGRPQLSCVGVFLMGCATFVVRTKVATNAATMMEAGGNPSMVQTVGRPPDHLAANCRAKVFNASKLSPKISMLSEMSSSDTRLGAWCDFSGASRRSRGSNRGRLSLPIHVSSSFCLCAAIISH